MRVSFILIALLPIFFAIFMFCINPLGEAQRLILEERFDDAIKLLDKAKKNPLLSLDPRIYIASASAKRQKKDIEGALSEIDIALEIRGKYPLLWGYKGFLVEHKILTDIRYEEALCEIEKSNYDLALVALDLALKEEIDPDILYQRALVHEYLENYREAEADFKLAIEKNLEASKKELAMHNRALYFIRRGQIDLAIIDLKAGTDQSFCSEAYCALATIYIQREEYDEAIRYLNKSLEKDKDSLSFRLRALAFTKKEEWQKALEDLDQVLKMEPENEAAKKDRQMVLKALKR